MSGVTLVLGNGPTKRIAIYGFALQNSQIKKNIIWYHFAVAGEAKVCPSLDGNLDTVISSLPGVNYAVADLAHADKDQYGSQRRRKIFTNRWEKSLAEIETGEADMVILEELDAALDAGWLKTNDIIQLLNQGKVKQFIVTGNYLPAGILGTANKLVEIWERENE